MKQNLVSITVTEVQADTGVAQLNQLHETIPGLITLTPAQRKKLIRMGARSDRFCRGVLLALQQNADLVPKSLDVAGAAAELEARDNLVRVLAACKQLHERLQDTVDALGSDVMVVANDGFKLMKSLGKSHALDEIIKELSYRHAKPKRKKEKPQTEPAGETDSEE